MRYRFDRDLRTQYSKKSEYGDMMYYIMYFQLISRVCRERRVRLHYLQIADTHLLRDQYPQVPVEEIFAQARRFQGMRMPASMS